MPNEIDFHYMLRHLDDFFSFVVGAIRDSVANSKENKHFHLDSSGNLV